MSALAPKLAGRPAPKRPALTVATRRRTAKLHLFTYVVGNAVFWALWAAIWVAAETWYWWAIVPLAGWALVLGLHLLRAYHDRDEPASG